VKKFSPLSPVPFPHGWGKGSLMYAVVLLCFFLLSCKSSAENKVDHNNTIISEQQYPVYIMSSGLHTGLIIPVNSISEDKIHAVKIFKDYRFIDFGWGDEDYYQKPGGGKFCLGFKAVAFPISSVMRVQGFNSTPEDVALWSDYAVRFNLKPGEFSDLCEYIDKSFRKDKRKALMETSRKRNGEIIFFKSVYYYHGFNTCNTWAARALNRAGLDISAFMVITADDLFGEVKEKGVILKGG